MLANSKKNRNIKANDVNLISAARSTDFCFKTTYVAMFLCFRSIVPCFQCLVRGPLPFGKLFPMNPPYPLEITAFEPPSPSEFPMIFLAGGGGGGVWIFSGTTCFKHFHCLYFKKTPPWKEGQSVPFPTVSVSELIVSLKRECIPNLKYAL